MKKKLDFSENLVIKSMMYTLLIYKLIPTFDPIVFEEFTGFKAGCCIFLFKLNKTTDYINKIEF